MLNLRLVAPPQAEPVSLALAKQHCRVDITDDDLLLTAYLTAAREWVETYTRRAIFTQSWELTLDSFPYGEYSSTLPAAARNAYAWSEAWNGYAIRLPRPSCLSVDSISGQDPSGAQRTLDPSSYVVDVNGEPARVVPAPGTCWPVGPLYVPGTVRIRYTAGTWGDGQQVNTCPQSIVLAILLLVGHWYRNREAVSDSTLAAAPLAVESLLRPLVFEGYWGGL